MTIINITNTIGRITNAENTQTCLHKANGGISERTRGHGPKPRNHHHIPEPINISTHNRRGTEYKAQAKIIDQRTDPRYPHPSKRNPGDKHRPNPISDIKIIPDLGREPGDKENTHEVPGTAEAECPMAGGNRGREVHRGRENTHGGDANPPIPGNVAEIDRGEESKVSREFQKRNHPHTQQRPEMANPAISSDDQADIGDLPTLPGLHDISGKTPEPRNTGVSNTQLLHILGIGPDIEIKGMVHDKRHRGTDRARSIAPRSKKDRGQDNLLLPLIYGSEGTGRTAIDNGFEDVGPFIHRHDHKIPGDRPGGYVESLQPRADISKECLGYKKPKKLPRNGGASNNQNLNRYKILVLEPDKSHWGTNFGKMSLAHAMNVSGINIDHQSIFSDSEDFISDHVEIAITGGML